MSHFKILRSPRFGFYFTGQLVSMSGTFMQQMVQAWLVYRLTGSAFWLGAIAFATQFPAFITSPIAGVITDRVSRKSLLIVVLLIQMSQALALGILTITGTVQIWHIAILSVLLGVTNAFELTSRHSLSVQLAGRENLSSTIALNAFIINTAKFIGPSLGGVFISLVGEAPCFFLNAVSYLAVILSLMPFHFQSPAEATNPSMTITTSLFAGFRYLKQRKTLYYPILYAGFMGLIGAPYFVLLPVFSKDILKGDASLLGWLTAAHSLGTLTGALRGLSRPPQRRILQELNRRIFVFALALIIFGLSSHVALTALGLFGCGYFLVSGYPLINHHLQSQVDESMRGRVLGLYMMMWLGTLPLGALSAGWLSEHLGPRGTIGIFVALTVCGLVAFEMAARSRKHESDRHRQSMQR